MARRHKPSSGPSTPPAESRTFFGRAPEIARTLTGFGDPSGPSFPVIRMPRQNRQRAINLLGRHHAHELVRPGHGAEADDALRRRAQRGVEAVGAADQEREGGRPLSRVRRKISAAKASLVGEAPRSSRATSQGAFGRSGEQNFGFLGAPRLGLAGARFVEFAPLDAGKPQRRREAGDALGVALEKLAFRAGFHAADREHGQPQSLSAFARFARTVRAPHLFEIVELADFGAEDVDDRVARVEQHPVVVRRALDFRLREARLAAGARNAIGDRADMDVRPPRGDDHDVGDGGFAR